MGVGGAGGLYVLPRVREVAWLGSPGLSQAGSLCGSSLCPALSFFPAFGELLEGTAAPLPLRAGFNLTPRALVTSWGAQQPQRNSLGSTLQGPLSVR